MPDLRVSTLSLQYIAVPVTNLLDLAADPTADPVQMAFKQATAEPASGDWKTASWGTFGGQHVALCLIGPGGGEITLAVGTWWPWVQLTDSPEAPVLRATAPFAVF
jgi:hypothetical protein